MQLCQLHMQPSRAICGDGAEESGVMHAVAQRESADIWIIGRVPVDASEYAYYLNSQLRPEWLL